MHDLLCSPYRILDVCETLKIISVPFLNLFVRVNRYYGTSNTREVFLCFCKVLAILGFVGGLQLLLLVGCCLKQVAVHPIFLNDALAQL